MKVLYEKIRNLLNEKPEWDKRDLEEKFRYFRISKQDTPQILKELKKDGALKLGKRKITMT